MNKFIRQLEKHEQDDIIAFAGDWHGRFWQAGKKLEYAAAKGVKLILHAGDFGIWNGSHGKRYLREMERKCEQLNMDIWVTGGNHEDWARIEHLWENPKRRDEAGLIPLDFGTKHIFFLPRPYVFNLRGVSFMSSGGAASVDFDVRTKDKDWWIQELISHEQVAKSIELGPADVLITHESPGLPYAVEAVEQIVLHNPMGFSELGLSYSAVSRKRCTELIEGVKPKLHVHGHFHAPGRKNVQLPSTDYGTTVLSLGDENSAQNLAYLHLDNLDEGIAAL